MNRVQLLGAKKLFFILLWVDIAVTVIVGINAFSTIGTLKDIQAGVRSVDQSLIGSLEFWEGFSKLIFLTMIGVGLGLVKWLNSCYAYSRQTIGASGFKNEGWTASGWIVPVFNLFKPYQVINEIYKAGGNGYAAADDWKKEEGSGALLGWWIFYAVTHFIGWMLTKQMLRSSMREDVTIGQAVGMTEVQAWSCVVSLVVAGLWFWVASLLTQRLLARNAISASVSPLQPIRQVPIAPAQPIQSASLFVTPAPAAPAQMTMPTNTTPVPSINDSPPSPFDEDSVYEVVANEMESGKTDKGLWTRLYAEFDGDENKTKIAYIKQRAVKLIDAERRRLAELENARVAAAAESERIRRMSLKDKLRLNLLSAEEISANCGGCETKFLVSCQRGTVQEIQNLIKEYPLLVAATNGDGSTGLHIAVEEGREDIVRLLLDSGAQPVVKNRYGATPYDLALGMGAKNPMSYPLYKKIADLIQTYV